MPAHRQISCKAALADIEAIVPGLGANRRRDLLAAGLRHFRDVGYHGASTRTIAESAGMSAAALYAHFESKSAMLYELAVAGHRSVLATVERAMPTDGLSGLAGTLAFMEAFVRWHAEHASLARVIQYEFSALTGKDRAVVVRLRRRIERMLEVQIRRGVEDGSTSAVDVATTVRALLSLGIDVARWYSAKGLLSPDELAKQYTELARRMLTAGL